MSIIEKLLSSSRPVYMPPDEQGCAKENINKTAMIPTGRRPAVRARKRSKQNQKTASGTASGDDGPSENDRGPSYATLIDPRADLPRLMSVSEVVKRYGIGRTNVYYLLGEGKLTAYKSGARKLLIVTQSVEDYVATLRPAVIKYIRPVKLSGIRTSA